MRGLSALTTLSAEDLAGATALRYLCVIGIMYLCRMKFDEGAVNGDVGFQPGRHLL